MSVAKFNTDERVGFSRLKFSKEHPVSWAMAVCEGQNLSKLKPGEIFGYGVDAGIGAFMDSSGGKEYMEFLMEREDNYEL